MPIYEYACKECGHEFERLVKMSAQPPPCPECGAEVRKKVSASGFILKGGGWYKDHYGLKPASSGSEGSKGSDSSSESKSASSSSAGSDS